MCLGPSPGGRMKEQGPGTGGELGQPEGAARVDRSRWSQGHMRKMPRDPGEGELMGRIWWESQGPWFWAFGEGPRSAGRPPYKQPQCIYSAGWRGLPTDM